MSARQAAAAVSIDARFVYARNQLAPTASHEETTARSKTIIVYIDFRNIVAYGSKYGVVALEYD